MLSKKVRLVRLSDNARRGFSTDLPERHIRFVDQQPLLVLSVASVAQLEARIQQKMSVLRFRPNIVVEGTEAHAEDKWQQFSVGGLVFVPLKPCTRCKITTVHPLTGEVGEEPLRALAEYRKGKKGVEFGFYYAHTGEGQISLGSQIKLLTVSL